MTTSEHAAATLTAINDALPGSTAWTDHRGDLHVTVKANSMVCEFSANASEGGVRAYALVDYGEHGTSFCEGRDYRTATGAVRFARKHLAR